MSFVDDRLYDREDLGDLDLDGIGHVVPRERSV
jgi:hypothetical protein